MMTCQQQQQHLVRFQNRTYVYNNNKNETNGARDDDYAMLQFVSDKTGWPRERLELLLSDITNNDKLFVNVRVISSIRGGKGGFGTLLRGSYRKQKASVVDYGACRTLTGQRLRDVQAAQAAQQQQQQANSNANTTVTTASLLRLPSQNSALPGWAPLNAGKLASKHLKRMEYQQKKAQRQVEERQKQKEAVRQREAMNVASYIQKANEASSRIETNVQSAIQQGILERKKKREMELELEKDKTNKNKRQRLEEDQIVEPSSPMSFIVCLSGDLGILYVDDEQKQQAKVQLKGTSNFGTAGILLNSDYLSLSSASSSSSSSSTTTTTRKLYYYEVIVVTGGLVQIGWAAANNATTDNTTEKDVNPLLFNPNSEDGTGVGDCKYSWAVDLSRQLKLHNEKEEPYGGVAGNNKWNAGDVVGCMLEVVSNENEQQFDYKLSFTLNGQDMGTAFEIPMATAATENIVLYPAVSCNPEEVVELHLHRNDMRHMPTTSCAAPVTVMPVGQYLANDSTISAAASRPQDDDNNTEDQKVEKEVVEPATKATGSDGNEPKEDITTTATTTKKADPPPVPVVPVPLDLSKYESAQNLEALGLDRLKSALMAVGCKCGGTLQERASRLFSIKGIADLKDIPDKLRAKKKKS